MRNSKGQFEKGSSFRKIHGESSLKTKEYIAWKHMKSRCLCKTDLKYDRYGGRGIKVCEQWIKSYKIFLSDVGRAPSRRMTLGRIDNDGDYEPNNVRWEKPKQQSNNTCRNINLTFKGKTQTIAQWAREIQLDYETLRNRVKYLNWSVEDSLTIPKFGKRNQLKNTGER